MSAYSSYNYLARKAIDFDDHPFQSYDRLLRTGFDARKKSLTQFGHGWYIQPVVILPLRKGARFMSNKFASVVVQVQTWARLPL
jgi:hypothetical protein